VTLRQENRQKKLVNRVLRRSGPKRDNVTEDWKRILNEEFYDFTTIPIYFGDQN
jgi:hypothetical protein